MAKSSFSSATDLLANPTYLYNVAWWMIALSFPTFLALLLESKTWGKTLEQRTWWHGPSIEPRLAWFLFESPNLLWAIYTYCFQSSQNDQPLAAYILFGFFVVHYIQRDLVYPWLLSPRTKSVPAAVVMAALLFTSFNGYLQCQTLWHVQAFPPDWHSHPQFILGLCLGVLGFGINIVSDATLRSLRNQGRGYQIPKGGLFEFVSTPHYFGEIMEWVGFAIACQFSMASIAL